MKLVTKIQVPYNEKGKYNIQRNGIVEAILIREEMDLENLSKRFMFRYNDVTDENVTINILSDWSKWYSKEELTTLNDSVKEIIPVDMPFPERERFLYYLAFMNEFARINNIDVNQIELIQ